MNSQIRNVFMRIASSWSVLKGFEQGVTTKQTSANLFIAANDYQTVNTLENIYGNLRVEPKVAFRLVLKDGVALVRRYANNRWVLFCLYTDKGLNRDVVLVRQILLDDPLNCVNICYDDARSFQVDDTLMAIDREVEAKVEQLHPAMNADTLFNKLLANPGNVPVIDTHYTRSIQFNDLLKRAGGYLIEFLNTTHPRHQFDSGAMVVYFQKEAVIFYCVTNTLWVAVYTDPHQEGLVTITSITNTKKPPSVLSATRYAEGLQQDNYFQMIEANFMQKETQTGKGLEQTAWTDVVGLDADLRKKSKQYDRGKMEEGLSFEELLTQPQLALKFENLWASNRNGEKFFTVLFKDRQVMFHRISYCRFEVIYFDPKNSASPVNVLWTTPNSTNGFETSEFFTSESFRQASPVQNFYAELIDFPTASKAVGEIVQYTLSRFEQLMKDVVEYIPKYVENNGVEMVRNTTNENEMAIVIQVMRLHVDNKSQLLAEKVFGLKGDLREDTLDFQGYRALREIREAFVKKTSDLDNLDWLAMNYRWLKHELS